MSPAKQPETEQAFRERLEADGEWEKKQACESQLVADGMPAGKARLVAEQKFGRRGVSAAVEETGGEEKDGRLSGGTIDMDWFKGQKTATAAAVVDYVFDHMDEELPHPASAPSPGAWSLLKLVREDSKARTEFIFKIWVKRLPSSSIIEHTDRAKADAVAPEEHVQRVLEAAQAAEAEEEGK